MPQAKAATPLPCSPITLTLFDMGPEWEILSQDNAYNASVQKRLGDVHMQNAQACLAIRGPVMTMFGNGHVSAARL